MKLNDNNKHNDSADLDALSPKDKVLRKVAIVVAFISTYYFLVKLVFL